MTTTHHHSYNKDFYSWTMESAALLREKKFEQIDIENLAEEIESMGKSEKRAFMNLLANLMAHLLKWKYQPTIRCRSWELSIENRRFEIRDLLKDSPSLKHKINDQFDHAYEKAIILAAKETGMEKTQFPNAAPFTLTECLDDAFLPE